jgi:hypothetical protein
VIKQRKKERKEQRKKERERERKKDVCLLFRLLQQSQGNVAIH